MEHRSIMMCGYVINIAGVENKKPHAKVDFVNSIFQWSKIGWRGAFEGLS